MKLPLVAAVHPYVVDGDGEWCVLDCTLARVLLFQTPSSHVKTTAKAIPRKRRILLNIEERECKSISHISSFACVHINASTMAKGYYLEYICSSIVCGDFLIINKTWSFGECPIYGFLYVSVGRLVAVWVLSFSTTHMMFLDVDSFAVPFTPIQLLHVASQPVA